jgi:plasmid stabilization system protein ParE
MSEARGIIVSPRARRQIERAVRWWRANRPAAPDLLERELAAILDRIARSPELGRSMYPPSERLPGLRRVLLSRTRYHLYFAPDGASGVLNVVALWHAERLPPAL